MGFIVMIITEVDIGLRTANFIRITMVEYKLSTQGFLKKIFQGVWKEKTHIKIIPIIIIHKFHHTLTQG